MREILFQGKDNSGDWVQGAYTVDRRSGNEIHCIITEFYEEISGMTYNFFHEIDPESLQQFTGKLSIKGEKIFEGAVMFEEVEQEHGDDRHFFLCHWIKELACFAFLNYGEFIDYQDNGIKALDDGFINSFNLESAEKLHYAGNYFDNPELFI